jgi:hypothetical protein
MTPVRGSEAWRPLLWLARAAALMAASALVLAPEPALAAAQGFLPPRDPIDVPFLRLALGLLLGVLLALIAALALKRVMNGGLRLPVKLRGSSWLRVPARQVLVHETHRVSLHGDVCRLGWRGREYLVVVSAGGVTLLAEKDETPKEAS